MLIGFGRRFLAEQSDDSATFGGMNCERVFIYETPYELLDRFNELLDFGRRNDVVALVHLDRLGSSLAQVLDAVTQLDERGMKITVNDHGIVPGSALGDSFGTVCRILNELGRETKGGEDNTNRRRGRPAVLDSETQAKALRLLSDKASVLEVARVLRVSPATIYRYFPRRGPRSSGKLGRT